MFEEQSSFLKKLTIVLDAISLICAFLLAYETRNIYILSTQHGPLYPFSHYFYLLLLTVPLFLIIFFHFEFYTHTPTESLGSILLKTTKAMLVCYIILAWLIFLLKFHFVSRLFLSFFAMYCFVFLILSKYLMLVGHQYYAPHMYDEKKILLCGDWSKAQEFIEIIQKNKEVGFHIEGFLSIDAEPVTDAGISTHMPILGSIEILEKILRKKVVDEVIFTFDKTNLPNMEKWILICEEMGVTVRIVANFFRVLYAKTRIESFYGLPLLTYTTVPYNYSELFIKRIIDFIGGVIGLLIFSPLFLIVAIAIKCNSRGTIFYRQTRLGQNGRKFVMYKFRSMVNDADQMKDQLQNRNEMDGPVFKMKEDPRITKIGRFLRKYSLDEFPQFINVLKGEMSLVGPRPPIQEEVEQYSLWQRRRLSMKPGLTCLWQIKGRSKIDFEEWMRLDLEYIDNWSLWLDFTIILRSIPAILTARGAF